MFRSEWFAERLDGVLVLFDRDCGSTSLTNDMDQVLAAIAAEDTLPALVIYRDSDGTYDQVLHRNGVFGGFRSLGATELGAALAIVRSRAAAESRIMGDAA